MTEDTQVGFWSKLKKHAGLKAVYSALFLFALFPTIYGSDWPERFWC
ncbi:hypothetical protein [Candidatus Pristimantibacillus sp. PTI5]